AFNFTLAPTPGSVTASSTGNTFTITNFTTASRLRVTDTVTFTFPDDTDLSAAAVVVGGNWNSAAVNHVTKTVTVNRATVDAGAGLVECTVAANNIAINTVTASSIAGARTFKVKTKRDLELAGALTVNAKGAGGIHSPAGFINAKVILDLSTNGSALSANQTRGNGNSATYTFRFRTDTAIGPNDTLEIDFPTTVPTAGAAIDLSDR